MINPGEFSTGDEDILDQRNGHTLPGTFQLEDGCIETSEASESRIIQSEANHLKRNLKQSSPLVPPLNFALVEDRIYRSGFPIPTNYPFLEQLGLKTIIYLGDDDKVKDKSKDKKKDKDKEEKKEKKKEKDSKGDIISKYKAWVETTDIKFHHLIFESSQEPFINEETQDKAKASLKIALELMLDRNNFPMLIHSNKGKHRIGVLVGLMRKLFQGWCLSGIFEEYEKFALGKSEYDLEIIELWQPELTFRKDSKPEFLRT
ncbi:hypothetical protein CLIB1444_07S06612 [[Candida] jaroonii]|uniref:Uncharacterized protein n=1 Tax=[Candida] jaroonii TaxID=467808 RepID=A0ACA9YAT9_9ASCO|nr:hypothetical protein CLIB1444_07S06612 [[Candida] jaroonii]